MLTPAQTCARLSQPEVFLALAEPGVLDNYIIVRFSRRHIGG